MLNQKAKQRLIAKFRTHTNDTGSPQVQIAILTEEIKQLTNHLKTHKKDNSSRRGLLKKVHERKKMLRYLEREDQTAFDDLTKKLKIKVRKQEGKTFKTIEEEMEKEEKEKQEWERLAEEHKKEQTTEEA